MYNELLDLYDDYSTNHLLADNKFVNKVFIIINKYHFLGNYLKEVFVVNNESEYLSISKTINISLLDIDRAFHHFKKSISNEDYVYLYNLVTLETIFHEIEHVYQEELKFSDEMSMEKTLLLLADPFGLLIDLSENPNFIERIKILSKLKKHNKYYDKRHNRAPHERIANLRAYAKTIAMINDYNIDNEGIKLYYVITDDLINKQIIDGYKLKGDITNSPSLDYLIGMKNTANKDIIENDKYYFHDMSISKEDRILYGLTLYKDEYLNLPYSNKGGK